MYSNSSKNHAAFAEQQRGSIVGAALGSSDISPQELPEVARELDMLNAQLVHLDGVVGSLCRRLQPVTMAVPVSAPTEASTKQRECYSQVGSSIAGARHTLAQQIQTLTGVLESLAV